MSAITVFYDHEHNWALSALNVMQNGGTTVPTINIQIAQSVTVSRTPRIEIEVDGDERASDLMDKISGGEWFYSHRACSVVTRIVTNRTISGQDHGAIRARVRWLYSREAQKFVSPAVTLYQTLEISDLGTSIIPRDPQEDREDITEFRHRIEYGILSSSVPTV